MKKIVLVNGLIAAAIIAGVSLAFLWNQGPDSNHSQAEWLGYLVMLAGLAFIFVAVKQHRDNNLGGVITFGQGFKVGLLVTLIAAIVYVLAWEWYYQNAGQGFIENYQQVMLEQYHADGVSENELAEIRKEMNEFAALYEKFYIRILITMLEILPVGMVVSMVAALLLKTRNIKP